MSPVRCTQGKASSQKISRAGAIDFGSSNVPMLSTMRPGEALASSAIDEPHSGQKCRRTGLPLLPKLVNDFIVPLIVTDSVGKMAKAPNALPVNFWQSRQ